MLDSMRGLAKSFVAKGLMILLVLSFALWGVGDMVKGHGTSTLVTVGDQSITPQQFITESRAMQQSLAQMGVQGVDPRAISGEVLRRMVQQRIIQQWQKDSGLAVSRETLAQALVSDAEFRGINNKFDPKLFQQALAQRQLSEGRYLSLLSEELGGKAMLAGITSSDIAPSENLSALSASVGNQTRDAVLFTIPASETTATDKDITTYYEQHKNQYATPERRTLEYVTLSNVKGDAQHVDELSMAIEDELAGGSSLGEAVAKAGAKAESKVLTNVEAGQFASSSDPLLGSVAEQGFSLGEGETSSLLTTPDGRYYLVAVKEVKPTAPRELKEVRSEVAAAASREKARAAVKTRTQALKKALRDTKDWEQAAKDAGATTRTVTDISRPVAQPDGSLKADTSLGSLQQAIFERAVKDIAGPMSLPNGDQVLAMVTAIHQKADASVSKKDIAAEYTRQLGNSVEASMFNDLAQRYKVWVNQPLLAQVTQQETPNE